MYVSYRYRTQIPFSLMRVLYDFRTLLMLLFKCVYFVLFFQKRKKWTICPSFNAPRVLTGGPNVTENWFENKIYLELVGKNMKTFLRLKSVKLYN